MKKFLKWLDKLLDFKIFDHKFFKNKSFRLLIFLIVLGFTFVLRAHNYDRSPGMGHLEEMAFGWAGIYLVETGVPVSWSTLDYPDRAEIFRGQVMYQGGDPKLSVRLYKPWLDQPPLFSILVGEFAHLYGAHRDQVLPASYIRMPVIFLSILTSIMLFLIARLVSGYWMGILSMTVWSLTPIMLFASRMAVPENLITPLYLIICYLLLKYLKKPSFKYIIFIPLLIGISGLSKATGFLILPLTLFFALQNKDIKSIIYLVILTLPFIGGYFWYGLHFDPAIFWRINEIQSQRPAGYNSLAWYFGQPSYDITTMMDAWFIFWLLTAGYFLIAPKEKLQKYILLFFCYWVIVVMISSGENDLLAWYRFPSYPLLAIIGAWGIKELFKNTDFFKSLLGIGFLLGNRNFLVNAFRENVTAWQYRIPFTAMMLPSLLMWIYPSAVLEKLSKWVLITAFVIGAFMNVVYIYNIFDLQCESKSCIFGPSTFLSTLYFPVLWKIIAQQ